MRQTGIYKITNLSNGKFYIGSSYNINNRWNGHKAGLKKSRWLSSDRKKEITKLANFLKISKPILQYDKEGNFIAEFPNARLAGESIGLTGIKYRNINRVAKGGKWNKHRHAAYGYIWKYKNNINN